MNVSSFPTYIIHILTRLNTAGHRAYAVGGCIRDSLLGRPPDDWDVCTSALPEETLAIFGDHALPTGLKHGTVTVTWENQHVEVTTFRTERGYSDHRRPDSVDFVTDVKEDLARRDFTINAMAMGLDSVLIDPFGGENDLKSGLIRCVGDANVRFSEDALRMFRALRFSAKLGFSIEKDTLSAIYQNAPLAADLAPERVLTELWKMLPFPCGKALDTLFAAQLLIQLCPQLSTQPKHSFTALETLPPNAMLRLCALCAILEQDTGADCEILLRALRCSTEQLRCCVPGAKAAVQGLLKDNVGMKHLLYALGEECVRCAVAAGIALGKEQDFSLLEQTLHSGECYQLSDLKIKGGDLLALGYQGKELGTALEKLLFHVMEHPEDNIRERLLQLL